MKTKEQIIKRLKKMFKNRCVSLSDSCKECIIKEVNKVNEDKDAPNKKEGLKLAIDIIKIYDINEFTNKSFRREILNHLYKELKSLEKDIYSDESIMERKNG